MNQLGKLIAADRSLGQDGVDHSQWLKLIFLADELVKMGGRSVSTSMYQMKEAHEEDVLPDSEVGEASPSRHRRRSSHDASEISNNSKTSR